MRSKYWIYGVLGIAATVLIYCNQKNTTAGEFDALSYLNLQDTVSYVGMNTCKTCHYNIYQTYIHTGMGRSFDQATRQKSDASFGDHALVYDTLSDFYYQPYFLDSTLFIKEFRLDKGDTIYQRTEKVSYIVGSGQHTNSHIVNFDGYVFQAPITYYTQEERWDMAPSFRENNQRFNRFLTTECITCHNHLPKHEPGSLNKYLDMPQGIECERCHGPGSVHVADKMAGNLIDTSQFIDYTIVNPENLPRDRQMDLCQRCHLQGITALKPGKDFYDFRPGMALSEVMNVFLPRYTNAHDKFIMASQADRLRLSPCYLKSETMTCITCHNPHHSVESTGQEHYNQACQSCHVTEEDKLCTASTQQKEEKGNNCISCHMPRTGSIDIPHVNITDHYISKTTTASTPQLSEKKTNDIAEFLGLQILTKEVGTPLEMAEGYLAMFDKYVSNSQILDSVQYYLDRCAEPPSQILSTWVHYYFNRKSYTALTNLATQQTPQQVTDAWTAYRIGEAWYQQKNFPQAVLFHKRAAQLMPYNLDFQEKLGLTYLSMQYLPQAMQVYEAVLKENRKRPIALHNLGFIKVLQGNKEAGEKLYDQALALNPDYVQALLNKAQLKMEAKKKKEARRLLERVLKIEKDNAQALAQMELM